MPDFGLIVGTFLPAFCLPVFAGNRAACVLRLVFGCPYSPAYKKSVKNILILVFSAY